MDEDLVALFDDAGDTDPDADDRLRLRAALGDDRFEAGQDVADDRLRVPLQPAGRQRMLPPGQFGEHEVEQLHPHMGLADVDPDEMAAARRDPQQRAGAAAVGLDGPGILHQRVGEQFADDVADRTGAEPGERPQFLTAHRTLEVQLAQQRRAVAAPQVADGPSVHLTHRAPSPGPNLPDAAALDADWFHRLTHGLNEASRFTF